jgi:dTDP-4-amino-4,6-dideoxygalactose transaminase
MVELPMNTIQHSQTFLREKDIQAVFSVLRSGLVNDSDITPEFEDQFARLIGIPWAKATSTGTRALYLAFGVPDLKPQAKIIEVAKRIFS